MMSTPMATCFLTMSATDSLSRAAYSAGSLGGPFSRLASSSILAGLGRLPTWVVRILVSLRFMQ